MMTARNMVETFQCPGCAHGENSKCGAFKLHEVQAGTVDGSDPIQGMRCENHVTTANIGGYVNLGLPIPFSRVQYREGSEGVKTNIRMHLYAVDYAKYWDRFNVPVWAHEIEGFLFVRTYLPRTDQSYVDVIQGGKIAQMKKDYPNVIDIGSIASKIQL